MNDLWKSGRCTTEIGVSTSSYNASLVFMFIIVPALKKER